MRRALKSSLLFAVLGLCLWAELCMADDAFDTPPKSSIGDGSADISRQASVIPTDAEVEKIPEPNETDLEAARQAATVPINNDTAPQSAESLKQAAMASLAPGRLEISPGQTAQEVAAQKKAELLINKNPVVSGVTGQAASFQACSEVMSAYAIYFEGVTVDAPPSADGKPRTQTNLFSDGDTEGREQARQRLRSVIEDCIANPSQCEGEKRNNFLKYISLLAQAKEIRRILLTCNTNYLQMRTLTPDKMDLGQSDFKSDNIFQVPTIKNDQANGQPSKPVSHVFHFDADIVRDVAASRTTRMNMGEDLTAYMSFALQTVGVPSVLANAGSATGASRAPASASSTQAVPVEQYHLTGRHGDVSQGGFTAENFATIAYPNDPSRPTSASAQGKAGAPHGDTVLTMPTTNQRAAVQKIVSTYLSGVGKKPTAADDPTNVVIGARDANSVAKELEDQAKPNELADAAAIAKAKDDARMHGQDPEKVNVVITADERHFAEFVNEIWPTSR